MSHVRPQAVVKDRWWHRNDVGLMLLRLFPWRFRCPQHVLGSEVRTYHQTNRGRLWVVVFTGGRHCRRKVVWKARINAIQFSQLNNAMEFSAPFKPILTSAEREEQASKLRAERAADQQRRAERKQRRAEYARQRYLDRKDRLNRGILGISHEVMRPNRNSLDRRTNWTTHDYLVNLPYTQSLGRPDVYDDLIGEEWVMLNLYEYGLELAAEDTTQTAARDLRQGEAYDAVF